MDYSYNSSQNQAEYSLFEAQVKKMQGPITFGYPINVLLITDRLFGCAQGLAEYLQNSMDIAVDLVHSLEDANQVIKEKPIDFLIIVGYLKNKGSYEAIQSVKRANKHSNVIMYASLDGVIFYECDKYEIALYYERFAPVDGFISFMREIYEDNRNMHTENASGK